MEWYCQNPNCAHPAASVPPLAAFSHPRMSMSHTPSASPRTISSLKGSSAIVPSTSLVGSSEAASAAESEAAAGAGTAAESAVVARRLGLAVAVDTGTEKLEFGGTELVDAASRTVFEATVEAFGGRMFVEPELRFEKLCQSTAFVRLGS
jgi:hypothetical protein